MTGINKVILIGNLGANPELRTTSNGDAIATISIATSESWIDKITGEKKEITEWHRCIFFKKQAETIGKYLHKGSKVYIEGKLKTRQWQDKEGKQQYITEIHCSQFQFLDGKSQTPYSELKNAEREENSVTEYSQTIDEEFPF